MRHSAKFSARSRRIKQPSHLHWRWMCPLAQLRFRRFLEQVRIGAKTIANDALRVRHLEEVMDEAELNDVEFGSPSIDSDDGYEAAREATADEELNEAHDSGTGLHTTKMSPEFVRRLAQVEQEDDEDVHTAVERGGPSLAEVQDLGPIEEFEKEVFEVVERPIPFRRGTKGAVTTKKMLKCLFCKEEFTYPTRDLHVHKTVCKAYRKAHGEPVDDGEDEGMVRVDEDDDLTDLPSVEDEGQNDDTQDVDEEEEIHMDEGGDNGLEADEALGTDQDESKEDSNEEDAEQTALVPDRIEIPGEDTHERRPVLMTTKQPEKEGRAPGPEVEFVREQMEIHSDSEQREVDEGRKDEADEAEPRTPVGKSTGSERAKSNNQLYFRFFSDEKGGHAQCRQCGKICANGGGALTKHRKKCTETAKAPMTRDDKQELLMQITPKRKATKRRVSAGQESEARDDISESGRTHASNANDSDADSRPELPPLRRSKRLRSDSKLGEGKSMEPAATSATDRATSVSPGHANTVIEGDPLDHFDLIGDAQRAKLMRCKHCEAELSFGRDMAVKHLGECDAFNASSVENEAGEATGSAMTHPGKTTEGAGRVATPPQPPHEVMNLRGGGGALSGGVDARSVGEVLSMDLDTARSWLFGSLQDADDVAQHYGAGPMVIRAPMSRFNIVRDALVGLNVHALLSQTALTTPITAMVYAPSNDHSSAPGCKLMTVGSPREAWEMYQCGFPLAFRPPEIVSHMLVPHLAADLNCGPLVSNDMHDVKLICARDRLVLDWQYHDSHNFIICLRGKSEWGEKKSGIVVPPHCFHAHPSSVENAEDDVKLQLALCGSRGGKPSMPPSNNRMFEFRGDDDDDEDMEDAEHGGGADSTTIADPGCVIYIPPGTWYSAKAVEPDGMLLQIQLKVVTYRDVAADAVRQLLWTRPQWGRPVQFAIDGAGLKATRQCMKQLLDGLTTDLQTFKPVELLPELLLTEEDCGGHVELVSIGPDDSHATKSFEFDLTERQGFKGGKHIRLLLGSMFRVNPLTVLMSEDEVPQTVMRPASLTAIAAAPATPVTPKKALSRKNKRGSNHHAGASSKPQQTFLLHFGFGNAACRSRMRVKFHCNGMQEALINWIRMRGTPDPFHVSELKKVQAFYLQQYHHHGVSTADDEALKLLLRFLCSAGYLTHVKVPL